MTPMKELANTRQAPATPDHAPRKRRSVRGAVTVTLAAAAIAALAGCTSPFDHAAGAASTQKTAAKPTAAATPATSAATTASATSGSTATSGTTATPGTTAKRNVSTTVTTRTGPLCPGQEAWSLRAVSRMKSLYADTGALAADASANNQPAIKKAGGKLAADALAAATLPLPPADPAAWKTLTAAYVAAGTALAKGDASGAVPPLENGNSALSAFSSAVAKCLDSTG